jgi:ribosome-associated heat shock protein Hsp15
MGTSTELEQTRLDKWLWAARFFKTRSLATAAVVGGSVHLNGARSKPSHPVKIGDELAITRRHTTWTVSVVAISEKRQSATVAQALYEESEASKAAREEVAAKIRADPWTRVFAAGRRPSKRERREIDKLRGR